MNTLYVNGHQDIQNGRQRRARYIGMGRPGKIQPGPLEVQLGLVVRLNVSSATRGRSDEACQCTTGYSIRCTLCGRCPQVDHSRYRMGSVLKSNSRPMDPMVDLSELARCSAWKSPTVRIGGGGMAKLLDRCGCCRTAIPLAGRGVPIFSMACE